MANSEKKEKYKWIKEYGFFALICFSILFILLLPSLLTLGELDWIKEKYFGNTNFSNTGEIGDTIGGITAPFIGILSIVLLYITFKEQRKFNDKQVQFNNEQVAFNKTQLKKEHENRDFSLLFNQLEFVDKGITLEVNDSFHYGIGALMTFEREYARFDYIQKLEFIAKLAVPTNIVLSFSYVVKRATFDKPTKDFFYISMYDRITWLINIYNLAQKDEQFNDKKGTDSDILPKVNEFKKQLEKAIALYF